MASRSLSRSRSSRAGRSRRAPPANGFPANSISCAGSVSEAEAKVEAFRSKSNLFVGANNTTLSNQQLSEISTQVSQLRAQKADAEAKAQLIRDTLRSGQSIESSEIVNSELIRRLSEQRMTLRAQLAEQSSTLLPQHPRIRELRAQIADLDQQIRQEGERLVRTLEADAKVADARLQSLLTQLRPAQGPGRLEQRPATSTARAGARGQGPARSVRILSRQIPRGDRPRQHRRGARRCAHHLARGRVEHAVFPEEAADGADRVACDLHAVLGLCGDRRAARRRASRARRLPLPEPPPSADPPPDQRPRQRLRPRGRTMCCPGAGAPGPDHRGGRPSDAPSSVACAGRAGRSGCDRRTGRRASCAAGEAGRRVAVVGAARDVGTTLTAIALARSLARDARVVLVNSHSASPNIDVISNDPAAPGIADLCARRGPFSDIITRDRFSRVQLVACGPSRGSARGADASACSCSAQVCSKR